MFKRMFVVVAISLALVVSALPLCTVHAILMTDDEVEMLEAESVETFDDVDDGTPRKKGNTFTRVVKAPFKAIGRLFGAGKKDDNKISRMREKDAKQFESAPLTRVIDARMIAPEQTATKPAIDRTNLDLETISDEEKRKLEAREQLAFGRQLLNSGDLNGAITVLSSALTLNPKLRDAHNLMGVAYESKGLRNLAFKSFELALKGDGDHPEHLNNLGYLYYKDGDHDNAIKYLKRAAKKAPENPRYWNNLGLAQAQLGKFDDAYKSFARAMGELEGHLNIATRLQRLGRFNEAIKHLEEARTLKPKSTDILARLVALYDHTGRANDAQEARNSITSLRSVATSPQ